MDQVVKLWDAKTLALKQTLGPDGQSQPHGLAFSPDGTLLAVGDPSKKAIELRNVETGSLERTLDTAQTRPLSLVFSPDGKTLIVFGQIVLGNQNGEISGAVQLWDARTWTMKHVLKQGLYVNTVAVSANGKLLASGGDRIQLWNAQTGSLIHSLEGLESGTRSVAISPDSQTVAAGGRDGKVLLWDAQSGQLKKVLKAPGWGLPGGSEIYSVAFSPDGKTLAAASQDQTVRLWKMPEAIAENGK
jgi:WD40 repeat protein